MPAKKKTAKKSKRAARATKSKSVNLTQDQYDSLLHHTHRMTEDPSAPTWALGMSTAEANVIPYIPSVSASSST
jgi:hypothetical protein